MKRYLSIVMLGLFVAPAFAFAVSDNANQGVSTQNSVATQAQTQNAGTDTQIQTQTTTETEQQTQTAQDVESTKQQYTVKNSTAETRSSEVAKAVQDMLEVANRVNNLSIGEQIRDIARAQNLAVDAGNKAVDKASSRSDIAKFFIGADYGQIKEAKKVMEQNQIRIRELQQIMLQLDNEADKTEIQEQINVLELQNLNLANQVNEIDSGFSLFGWFVRWFYGA